MLRFWVCPAGISGWSELLVINKAIAVLLIGAQCFAAGVGSSAGSPRLRSNTASSVTSVQALVQPLRWTRSTLQPTRDTWRQWRADRSILATPAPGAFGFWLHIGVTSLPLIGFIEGLVIGFVVLARIGGRFRSSAFTASAGPWDSTLRLSASVVPDLIAITFVVFLGHYFFGVIRPYTRTPAKRDLGLSHLATTWAMSGAVIGVPLISGALVYNGVAGVISLVVGFFIGPVFHALSNKVIERNVPSPLVEKESDEEETAEPQSAAKPARVSRQMAEMVQRFGLGEVLEVDWLPGGASASSTPLPVITTVNGRFVAKPIKAETLDDAKFILEYMIFLKRHGVPMAIWPKAASSGQEVEDYYISLRGRWYTVERFVEGRIISRRSATRAQIRAVARMLARIHTVSAGFVSHYQRSPEHYSFAQALDTIFKKDAAWVKPLEKVLSAKDLQTIRESQWLVDFWNPERFKNLRFQAIPSDLNFRGIRFDQRGRHIIGLFDFDAARMGYRFEDFFATLTQGEPPLYVNEQLHPDLTSLIVEYGKSVQPPLSQEEFLVLPAAFETQVLWKIVKRAKSLKGIAAENRHIISEIRALIPALEMVRKQFAPWAKPWNESPQAEPRKLHRVLWEALAEPIYYAVQRSAEIAFNLRWKYYPAFDEVTRRVRLAAERKGVGEPRRRATAEVALANREKLEFWNISALALIPNSSVVLPRLRDLQQELERIAPGAFAFPRDFALCLQSFESGPERLLPGDKIGEIGDRVRSALRFKSTILLYLDGAAVVDENQTVVIRAIPLPSLTPDMKTVLHADENPMAEIRKALGGAPDVVAEIPIAIPIRKLTDAEYKAFSHLMVRESRRSKGWLNLRHVALVHHLGELFQKGSFEIIDEFTLVTGDDSDSGGPIGRLNRLVSRLVSSVLHRASAASGHGIHNRSRRHVNRRQLARQA
jgi:Ser/Thr protein kinase RdoA (MazF antagonist)